MATTIDTAVTALQTAITAALGPAPGTAAIAACRRKYIIPAREHDRPVVGLIIDRGRRLGGLDDNAKWETTVLVQILAAAEREDAEAACLELLAAVLAVVDAVNGGGSAGGFWDLPAWEYWTEMNAPTVPCGVLMTLRLRTDGPLAVAE